MRFLMSSDNVIHMTFVKTPKSLKHMARVIDIHFTMIPLRDSLCSFNLSTGQPP